MAKLTYPEWMRAYERHLVGVPEGADVGQLVTAELVEPGMALTQMLLRAQVVMVISLAASGELRAVDGGRAEGEP